MIRINLLAQSKALTASSAGQGWVLVIMLVVVFEIGGFFFYFGQMQEQLAEVMNRNRELQEEIDTSKKKVQGHADVKKRLEELRAREAAITQLQSARTGPTAAMLELASILTPGRGPSVDASLLRKLRRDEPGKVHNPNWDPRGLYLTTLVEASRNVVLEGFAKSGEDFSEFSRRLELSRYFGDVKLVSATRKKVSGAAGELISFKLTVKVLY